MIVGLSGYASAGKDSMGTILQTKYGFTRIAFADKMKEFAYRLDPVVIIDQDGDEAAIRLHHLVDQVGWDEAKQHPDVRGLLQRLGTDAGRTVFGDTIWTRAALVGHLDENIVVTDVRFPDEATYIKSLFGNVVRIHRPGFDAPNDHISEHALDDWDFDYELSNDRGLHELAHQVDKFVTRMVVAAAS